MNHEELKFAIQALGHECNMYRFEVNRTIKSYLVKGYRYNSEASMYHLFGYVIEIFRDGYGFKSLDGFKKIDDSKTKLDLLYIAIRYCEEVFKKDDIRNNGTGSSDGNDFNCELC